MSSESSLAHKPADGRSTGRHTLSAASFALISVAAVLFVQSLMLLLLPNQTQLGWNLELQVAIVIVVAIWSHKRTGTYLNPVFLFVVAIYFWHSPFLTGYFFSLSSLFEYTGNTFSYGEQYVPIAAAMVSLCMTAASVGAFVAYGQDLPQGIGRRPIGDWRVRPAIAWGLFAGFSVISLFYLVFEARPSFEAGYFSQYTANEPETPLYRLFSATKFFGVLAILLVFQAANTRGGRYWAIASTSTLIFAHLLLGARSTPFLYALALLVAIDYFIRRVPLWLMLVVGIAASAASFIVDQTRAFGIGLQIFDFRSAGVSINLLSVLWDAGSVIKTVLRTIEFSARSSPLWGLSFFDAALAIIPTPFLSVFGLSRQLMHPSVWLVENSPDVIPGAGLGYSLVAEAYLNFRIVGVVLFFVVGWCLARLYRKGQREPSNLAHIYSLFAAILLTLNIRNDVATYLRILFWGYLLLAALRPPSNTRMAVNPVLKEASGETGAH